MTLHNTYLPIDEYRGVVILQRADIEERKFYLLSRECGDNGRLVLVSFTTIKAARLAIDIDELAHVTFCDIETAAGMLPADADNQVETLN